MNTLPRRSPRFQQQSQNTQSGVTSIPSLSSFPSQTSSTTSTSHPSPISDGLNLPNQPSQYPLQLQSQFLAPAHDWHAPLPSPSTQDINPFYFNSQTMGAQAQTQPNTNSFQGNNNTNSQTQSFGQQQPQQQHQHHSSFSQPQRPNFPPTSTNGIPPGLPPDFLAEAAKRAQMACLMRDLGDVSL